MPAATQFTQVQPRDGSDASERSDVRVVYDGDAIYIGARLYDTSPSWIAARLGRRDASTNSDLFAVSIDSYHDHRTAYRFMVNAAGVKTDGIAANDASNFDNSWDPVWDAAAHVDSAGWTVEMRIPLSQLRFSSAAEQVWGINFERYILRSDELVRWSWVANTESGYASRFGHLVGLHDVSAARSHKLEVLPYAVSQGDFDTAADPKDPFGHARRGSSTIGADFKYGVSSGLTLTGTLNPDFGQVEADPAEVNLTVFETYFQERRPFFVEGANLFSFGAGGAGFIFGAPQLFYSRRVGRPPSGGLPSGAVFFDSPEVTSIRGAGKLSGQVGGWSVALLDAVTAREEAAVMGAGNVRSNVTVEPRTNYTVAGLRRDFRGGLSGVGFFGTSVIRDIDTASLDFLRKRAQSGGVDFYHRFGRNQYSISGALAGAFLHGDTNSIISAQRSSARYYQRPDQEYAKFDPHARDLSGYAFSVSGGKVAGNWLVGTDFFAYSPGFEINDMGFQQTVDRIFHGIRVNRRWLGLTKYTRFAQWAFTEANQWNYGGTRVSTSFYMGGSVQLLNYWSLSLNGNYNPETLNDRITRGGPLEVVPRQWNLNGNITSDQRRSVASALGAGVTRNKSGGFSNYLGLQFNLRPSSAVTVTLAPSFNELNSAAGYVTTTNDPTATAMYGRRYIVADQHQRSIDLTTRADLSLTSTLSLQLYAQPFVAAVHNSGYKAFVQPQAFEFLTYGRDAGSTITYDKTARVYRADPDGAGPAPTAVFGDPDFRVRSLRANLVLRWEYRAGSTLYLAWAHGRRAVNVDPRFDVGRDLDDLRHDDQRNRLLVKVSYWFNP